MNMDMVNFDVRLRQKWAVILADVASFRIALDNLFLIFDCRVEKPFSLICIKLPDFLNVPFWDDKRMPGEEARV